jgi:hypothetical protein
MDRLICWAVSFGAKYSLTIVKLDTVIRWHRTGFRSYWRWKSRHCCGRPTVSSEIRRLIREMNRQPVVGSAGWKTFLRNHAVGIVVPDLFVVPTISFRLLYGLLIMATAGGRSCGLGDRAPDGRMDRQSAH